MRRHQGLSVDLVFSFPGNYCFVISAVWYPIIIIYNLTMISCLNTNFSLFHLTIFETLQTVPMSTNRLIDSQTSDIGVCVDE